MNIHAVRALLASAGYSIHERDAGWNECLLVREQERWLGRGATPDGAILDAVNQSFPSHLSRELLHRALDSIGDVGDFVVAAPVAPESPSIDAATSDAAPPAVTNEALAAEVKRPTGAAPAAVDALPITSPSDPQVAPRLAVAPNEPPLPERDTLVEPLAGAQASRSTRETLGELDARRSEINAALDELGLCSPDRQRAAITGWLAQLRVHHDEFPDDRIMNEGVRRAIGTLGRMSKTWWPGFITALSTRATPDASVRQLDDAATAESWSDVARIPDTILAAIEKEDADNGFDEFGWADARECEPAPTRPTEMLADAVREIELTGGP